MGMFIWSGPWAAVPAFRLDMLGPRFGLVDCCWVGIPALGLHHLVTSWQTGWVRVFCWMHGLD